MAPAIDAASVDAAARGLHHQLRARRLGAPVSGAIVSAVGGRTLTGTTDAKGRCTLAELPAGEYLVRVHRAGFGTPTV